ncbi:hypothetical protein [Lentilactobacillus parafarraginis]|uniref:hypothetical protein n=1 Tax=Lentilactobacillus parafarraginis TaxID=390842 RepID=UPI0006D017FF|nr:hypothetical protein [Lentilactobacillus parafarraginis]
MNPFKKTEKQREEFLRNIRFIDKSVFGTYTPDPQNSPEEEQRRIKSINREYHHEIRREKGEMRILHFKLFMLGTSAFLHLCRQSLPVGSLIRYHKFFIFQN